MSDQNNDFSPNIPPTELSPPPESNISESLTKKENVNPQMYQRPNNNTGWQSGDSKTDLEGKTYIIEKQLGQGGFAITYLATESGTQKQVVLKVLKDELRSHPHFRVISNSFINEAVQLKACRSPFIVKVDKVTEIDDKQVIVMEYIEGQTLGDKVREQGGIIRVNLALKYIKQVGEALKEAHGQDLLHRDIKPDNIMIRAKTDQAVLIDFGLALKFDPNNLEFNRQWLTPGFAPIEQYQPRVKWGFYTDVYSLVATLYYIVTGVIPLHPEDRLAGIKLDSPQKLNNDVNNTVNFAILEGLKVAPEDRPQTVKEWLDLLDKSSYFPVNKLKLIFLLLSLGILGLMGLWFLRQSICESVSSPLLVGLNICNNSEENWTNYQDYESREYEFSLKYPSGWKIEEVPKNVLQPWELRFYAPTDPQELIMIIVVKDLESLYSLDEYWQDVVKPSLKNRQLKDIEIEGEPQPIKLKVDSDKKEHPALMILHSYTTADDLIQNKEIITVYNYRGYTILFRGNEKAFKKYQKQADQVTQSFKFTIP